MQNIAEAYRSIAHQSTVIPTLSRKAVDDWHTLVRQSLATQRQWSGFVVGGLPSEPLPAGARTLVDQGRNMNTLLLDLQDQTWTRWFDWLRSLTGSIDAKSALEAEVESAAGPLGKAEVESAAGPLGEAVVDDLTTIDGIGPAIAAKLHAAGIDSYIQLAAWSDSDIEQVENTVLGGRLKGRVRRDDWVGQANGLSGQH